MADISITPGSVLPGTSAVTSVPGTTDVYGETVTAGMAVYLKVSDKKIYKALANGTAAQAAHIGIARIGGSAGQPAIWQSGGTIAIGGTTVAGTIYCLSKNNAGGIGPWADLAATNYVSIVGVGDGLGNIVQGINNTGVLHA